MSGSQYTAFQQQPSYQNRSNWNQDGPNGNQGDEEVNHSANPARLLSFDEPQGYYRANMAVIEENKKNFGSSVARLGQTKTPDILIDSGGTHNFFHSLSSFSHYERINTETVRAAFSKTNIIGKGLVWVPLNGGMQMTAYHTPQFTSNILSVSELSDHLDVLFSSSFKNQKGCYMFKQGTRDIVFETLCQDGLYILRHSQAIEPKEAVSAKLVRSKEQEWHNKTGHPSIDRYMQLSYIFPTVPTFSRAVMNKMVCIPCLTGKAKRAAIRAAELRTGAPLQEVHLDISGPYIPALTGETYAVHFIEAHTAKSDVMLLTARSNLSHALTEYKSYVETHFAMQGYRIQTLRLDQAGENVKGEVLRFCKEQGIKLNPSPPHAPESNGTAERIVQEHWTRARVMMFASKLPANLWGEALKHANWLRNRLPSSRINNQLPIMLWSPNTPIDFVSLMTFGEPGFGFIYRSKTVARKKLLPRAELGNFVGMESDTRLMNMYVPAEKRLRTVRLADFKTIDSDKLPSISVLLDGLSRQHTIEAQQNVDEGQAEAHLVRCLTALYEEGPIIKWDQKKNNTVHDIPSSFEEACQTPEWAAAIDREYEALERRQTWKYVLPTTDMNVIKHKWVFRKKPLDADGKRYLPKARCVARGDLQEPFIDFDPGSLYAPVASHESLRLILAYAASHDLIIEGADISNAYLYGRIDTQMFMEQPTNSSGQQQMPGYVCELQKSIYGVRQAGNIWGSIVHTKLLSWGFKASKFDSRVYFLRANGKFIIMAIVVDDMAFAASDRGILQQLKSNLTENFDVKLYGSLHSFIGWNITQSPKGIKVDQAEYARTLLNTCGMLHCNTVRSPLPLNADVLPASPTEQILSKRDHRIYRAVLGGLMYLSVCTRPDLSFPVTALARQMHGPCARHFKLLKRILRYVAGTMQFGLHYGRGFPCSSGSLGAAVDADWGGDIETRRSTTGYLIAINRSPVHWQSKRQTVIALSSAEAEYVALSSCAKTLSWFRKLYWEVCHQIPWTESNSFAPTQIAVDSTAALSLATKAQVSARNKHISLKVHHVRELTQRGIVQLYYVPSEQHPADMMTKGLTAPALQRMTSMSRLSAFFPSN